MNKKFFFLIGGITFTVLFVSLLAWANGFFGNNKQTAIKSSGEEEIVLPSSEVVLGQNFVLGIPGMILDEETKEILREIKPAGIVLYYRNYQTYEQFKNLVTELQEFAKATTGYYYFIMIDEEPGGATRLNLFKNVFDTGMPDWERIEQDIGKMASLGINVALAPLADFPFNEDTFIKRRIPAHSPEALTDFNKEFISLLRKANISATLKHFPGMGVFIDDPHKKIPYVSNDQKIIDESIILFKSGIDAGADFVMTGHAVYDDIDPNITATLSKKITTEILRDNLGFKGLAITDDLSDMPFIVDKNIYLTEATAEALKAGHNLVIFSHRPDKMIKIFDELLQRMQNDTEFKSFVEKNYRKVVFFKQENYLNFPQ